MLTNPLTLELEHLPQVASVHLRAFPESALTRLGHEAVRRYYEWQLLGPHDHDFAGIWDQEKLLGYIVAGRSRGALSGFVAKNKWYLVARLAVNPQLVFTGKVRKAMGSALSSLRRIRTQAAASGDGGSDRRTSYGILAIAVDPFCQGKGVGLQLMQHCEKIAREEGFPRMHLSVSVNNARAIRFYESLGWKRTPIDGVWTGQMEKLLS